MYSLACTYLPIYTTSICGLKLFTFRITSLKLHIELFRYENDLEGFKDAAKACVQAWKERTYEAPSTNDPHYPAFSHYQPHIHEPVRATMLAEARKVEVSSLI